MTPQAAGEPQGGSGDLCSGCDDHIGCNGIERCDEGGRCLHPPATCPVAPPECAQSGGEGAVTANTLTRASAGHFALTEWGFDPAVEGLIDALRVAGQNAPASASTILGDLNRQATRVSSHSGVYCFNAGFEWNSGDGDVDYWWPQGLTGSADASEANAVAGEAVALVSWYHKPDVDPNTDINKGARISWVKTTGLSDLRYRHLLLVDPYTDASGRPNFRPKPTHAGGIVWFGRYLYVAETSSGFSVYDMERMFEVSTGLDHHIGYNEADGKYYAANYKYVIPRVGGYTLCAESCCARFSFASLDRSTQPPTILSGSYTNANTSGHLHRWPLNPATGRLATTQGVSFSGEVLHMGVLKAQGALSYGGRYYISSSHPKTSGSGSLYAGQVGAQWVNRGGPYLPEDLHYSPSSDRLWSLTEPPGRRVVYGVLRAHIDGGCP